MALIINSSDFLSKDQLNKSMRIYAGPGAGKTHFLVENIKNIIATNEKIVKSNNRKILSITYTNAAVAEIKSRLDSYNKQVEVYTIHGFIIKHIIMPYQSELIRVMKEDFNISISGKRLISSQIEGLGLLHGIDKTEIYDFINQNTGLQIEYSKTLMSKVQIDIKKYFEEGKSILVEPQKVDRRHLLLVKECIWNKARKLTHDEILYFGYRIVESNSTICYALRVQFPYIFIDEFQDTNPLQTKLLQYIGGKSTIIGVIGDIAQSIYSFQGAKPSMFANFSLAGQTIENMLIEGNRRSTVNIIKMCNYIRQSDELVQVSVKQYKHQEEKETQESKKVHFLIGFNQVTMSKIDQIILEGGVVLTRAWAAAFEYMSNVSAEQKSILKKIYNSYYASPIDIRSEIVEHSNVSWVKAYRFLFTLTKSFYTNSVADIINAFSFYVDTNKLVKESGLTIKRLLLIRRLLTDLSKHISSNVLVVDIITKLNSMLKEEDYLEVSSMLATYSKSDVSCRVFQVSCFNDQDREDLIENVNSLEWHTAQMLFEKVFSSDSQYMTVHQAKGLEWSKVVVSLKPTKFDKTSFIDMFLKPSILSENEVNEFARMFYVACSRAKDELYIHVDQNSYEIGLMKQSLDAFCKLNNYDHFFEFYDCD